MEALIGNPGSHLPQQLPVMIHAKKVIECHLSPRDKHFADVNVLGADFLVENGLTLKAKQIIAKQKNLYYFSGCEENE